ncbi:MAG: NYN domain-containing protein, partial [bacterium]|nr:NYN domain-containing protein [bacterium]
MHLRFFKKNHFRIYSKCFFTVLFVLTLFVPINQIKAYDFSQINLDPITVLNILSETLINDFDSITYYLDNYSGSISDLGVNTFEKIPNISSNSKSIFSNLFANIGENVLFANEVANNNFDYLALVNEITLTDFSEIFYSTGNIFNGGTQISASALDGTKNIINDSVSWLGDKTNNFLCWSFITCDYRTFTDNTFPVKFVIDAEVTNEYSNNNVATSTVKTSSVVVDNTKEIFSKTSISPNQEKKIFVTNNYTSSNQRDYSDEIINLEQKISSLNNDVSKLYNSSNLGKRQDIRTQDNFSDDLADLSVTLRATIPISASTTNWNSFFDTPSTRITAGTGLSWSGNTLNASASGGSNWTLGNGFLRTSTTTDGVLASYFNATSTTATSTFAGYVGIGTTTPGTNLTVAGNGFFTGGIGIGILNTIANTFRVGQCVTGDTKLRRRRKINRKKNVEDFNDSEEEYEYDEVQIKDIKEGDEIQSLNEKTGTLVWSKVKQLAYMGNKPIFKLTTESGKSIRTTGNHPYFVKTNKDKNINNFSNTVVLIDYSNIKAWLRNKDFSIDLELLIKVFHSLNIKDVRFYYGSDLENPNILGFFKKLKSFGYLVITKSIQYFRVSLSSLLQQKTNRQLIENISESFKKSLDSEANRLEKEDISLLTPKANFDVEITTDAIFSMGKADQVVLFSGDGDFAYLIKELKKRGKNVTVVSGRKSLSGELVREANKFVTLERFALTVIGLVYSVHNAKPARRQVLKNCSDSIASLLELSNTLAVNNTYGSWNKVMDIKVGQSIAIVKDEKTIWDPILNIESLSSEDVFDIEIENTHNFIGNDIVAHNTAFHVNSSGNTLVGGDLNVTGTTTLANASTTAITNSGSTWLTSLSIGGLAVNSNGLVYSSATTTAGTGLAYFGNAFNVNTSQNISVLSNLSSNGAILTSGSNGTLGIYTGTSCTNQFIRSLDGSLVSTCASVANTDLTNSTIGLTSTGSITVGSSPISLGGTSALNLNMANENSWIAKQTFVNASTTNLSVGTTAYFPGSGIWDSGGNVGIGTTSPDTKLSIVGTTTITGHTPLIFRDTDGSVLSRFEVYPAYNGAVTPANLQENFRIGANLAGDSSVITTALGNIGIG